MHNKVFYFSIWEDQRLDFYTWVKGGRYDITADFQLVGEDFVCRSSKDLLLYLDKNKRIAKTLYVIIDFLPFFSKPGREEAAKNIRNAILGYPEVFFLFDESFTDKEDYKVFLYKDVDKDILDSVLSEYHIFNRSSKSEHFVDGSRQINPFEVIYHKRSNLFDGSNLRYSLKVEEYNHLKASVNNFGLIQSSRAHNLVICIEEERTQNRFNSYAAHANGFRVLPILSSKELKWFNTNYKNTEKSIKDLKLIIRDYDLQFFDANEEDSTLKPRNCKRDENLVDYIRGAKDLKNDNTQKLGNWLILDNKDNNWFWNNLKKIPRIFVSKGVLHMNIFTNKWWFIIHRHDFWNRMKLIFGILIKKGICHRKFFDNKWWHHSIGQTILRKSIIGQYEISKERQCLRGLKKPVSGIYSSFQSISIIREQYNNYVSWNNRWKRNKEKEEAYYISTQRREHDHGVPLDIYELTKSMIDRARWYYNNGKFVISAIVSWEVIEILNGFHLSLMLKAYHIYAISENAICMNILGGREKWLKEDAALRVRKIRDDIVRILASEEKTDRDGLQINILNQIYSDCRNFCREKEHFDSESVFIGAMAHLNEGSFIRFLLFKYLGL